MKTATWDVSRSARTTAATNIMESRRVTPGSIETAEHSGVGQRQSQDEPTNQEEAEASLALGTNACCMNNEPYAGASSNGGFHSGTNWFQFSSLEDGPQSHNI